MIKTISKLIALILTLVIIMAIGIDIGFAKEDGINGKPPRDPDEYGLWKQQIINNLNNSGATFYQPTSMLSPAGVYNDYMNFVVEDGQGTYTGRFTIGTTGGDPTNLNDDNSSMMFGHPTPASSYTTIRLDGTSHIYRPNTMNPTINQEAASNTSEQTIGSVSIKQVMSIVNNTNTGRDDTVEVKYIVKNNDVVPHNAGLRIMLDTLIGNDDAVPIRVPGVGILTKEYEILGNSIPEYWQAFDNIATPTLIAHGTLLKSINNKPDKVQFANWYNLYENDWECTLNAGYEFSDSAVGIYWNAKQLASGETREYVTYYGLSQLVQDLRPPLGLSLTGASVIAVNGTSYEPNPFTVTAYVNNTNAVDAKNVKVRINLPQGLKLASGQQEIGIDVIRAGEEKIVSWSVGIEPSSVDRNLTYEVTVSADNTESKTLGKTVFIPALPVLGIPDNITTTATQTEIKVSWDAVTGATGYDIEVDGVIKANVTSPYTHAGLISGTAHTYRVRARNATLVGGWSEPVSQSTIPNPPDVPQNVNAVPARTEITVTWDTVTEATGYDIEVDGVIVENVASPYMHIGLTSGTQHTYKVRAKNAGGVSDWSTLVTATTLPNPPPAPINLSTVATQTDIKVSWDAVTGATGYDIEVDGVVVENVTSPYTHIGLTPGTQHTYRVRAKNIAGVSVWSQAVTASTLPAEEIKPPYNLTAEIKGNKNGSQIKLDWDFTNTTTATASYDIEVNGTVYSSGTSKSYTIQVSTSIETYTFKVRAKIDQTVTEWSAPLGFWTVATDSFNVVAREQANSTGQITVTWNAVADATGYDIMIDGVLTEDVMSPYSCTLTSKGNPKISIRAKKASVMSEWSKPINVSGNNK